jgi:hypothetical protein
MDIEKLVEDGARALCEATSGPFELLTPEGRSACRHEARAVLALALKAAAEEAEPNFERGCGCEHCDCLNIGNAQTAAEWDALKACAARFRTLAAQLGGSDDAH